MNRVKYITQKRSSLKRQFTGLEGLINNEEVDLNNAKLRMEKLKEQFAAYEELHDELADLDPDNESLREIDAIQDRYFTIAAKVASLLSAQDERPANNRENTIVIEKSARRVKLPVVQLPKFDGDLKNWLSFKNTFTTMVDERDDIDDLQKFLLLKDSLLSTAGDKISTYTTSAENYSNAWKLLLDAYDKKRVLIATHLDALLDLPAQSKPTHQGLTRLVDEMRQHVNMLASLDVVPDKHLLIRILERALPRETRLKWEEDLNLDEFPTMEEIYKFISESAFRLYTIERDTTRLGGDNGSKRQRSDAELRSSKARKGANGARVFITEASVSDCSLCKGEKHRLYRCPAFGKMSIRDRWGFVKEFQLCHNCLQTHPGVKCPRSHCQKCDRYHNTLLHSDSRNSGFSRRENGARSAAASGSSDKANAGTSNST